jgi:hypothetical protein
MHDISRVITVSGTIARYNWAKSARLVSASKAVAHGMSGIWVTSLDSPLIAKFDKAAPEEL